MQVTVAVGGKTETVDVDVDRLTLAESVVVQRLIGNSEWDDLTDGVVRPVALQAIVYAKLKKQFPDLEVDSFDFDFSDTSEVDPTETG